MKNERHTIATTSIGGFSYEDYKEWCEMNGKEAEGEDSTEFYYWCAEEMVENWESDLDNIKECKEYNKEVVIEGTLGLWDGRHEIVPVMFDSVRDAIDKVLKSSDDKVIEVVWENGHIYVTETHHDGVNEFEIKPKDGKKFPYLYAI